MQLKKGNKILIFLLLTTSYLLLAIFANAQTDSERIEQLRQQIEQLEKEAQLYRGNIAGEQAKAKSLQGEISILNNQIKKIQAQMSITSKNINKTEIEITDIGGKIFDTQKNIDYKKDTIAELLLAVYKKDSENLITILLKNANISDFFRQTQYSASINTALFDLISEMKTEKNTLENNKDELENKKSELENLKEQQGQQNNSLSQTKTGKSTLLTQTKCQEAQYQKMLADVEHRQTLFFTEL